MDQLSFIAEVGGTVGQTEPTGSTPPKACCSSSTLEMLRLLASLGVPKELLASLLEMAEFSIPHVRYFAGPLVLHRSLWADAIPPWLKAACLQDRLELILHEHEQAQVGEYATPTEVLTYMMPATYEAPMQRDYSDLYLWVGNEVLRQHNRLPEGAESLYDWVGGSRIEFNTVKTEFYSLSRSIRQSVVKHAAQEGWGKRRQRSKAKRRIRDAVPATDQPKQAKLF